MRLQSRHPHMNCHAILKWSWPEVVRLDRLDKFWQPKLVHPGPRFAAKSCPTSPKVVWGQILAAKCSPE